MITATAILTETIVVTAYLGGNVCQPATWTLVDEDANVLDTGSIISGGAETIIAPDGTVLRDGLAYGSVLSGGTIDVPSDTCADATIDINGLPFDTVASGGTLDIPVISSGSNPVGSQIGTDWVIANNATYINSVQVTDQEAEVDASITVILDGIPSGTWNAGLQLWEVTSDPCLDGNIELNGVQVATVASGGTEDIPVLSEGSNPVGSLVGSDWVIENNATTINGVQVTDQEAEQDAAIFVTRDGVQNGSWNAGTQTWEVTSAPCSPVTFQINAVNKESLSSGSTFNLITKLDGAVNSGSYDAPTDTLSFTSAACSPAALQINGTPQESIAAGATFNLIATLDGVAGGTYTPATDTLAFTSNSGWIRPSFWPALPTLTAASEAGYILLPVYENRINRFSLQINNSTVDWGDGTTSAPSGSVRTKTYDYATISATVYVDALTGENYKFVIIGITRTGSPITFVYLAISAATSPTRNYNYGVDWNFSFPNCTDFFLSSTPNNGSMVSVKQFKLWSSGAAIMVAQYMRGIESLQLPSFPSMSLASAFRFLGGVRIGNVNFGLATSLQQSFIQSNIISFGNITANSVSSASEMLSENYQLESVGTITMTSVTNLGYVFANDYVIKSIGLVTANSCTILEAFAFSCNALIAIRFANCANVTNTSQMIQNCFSLQVLDMPNLTRGVNFTGTSIGNYGMNIFASGDGILNGVGTASGAQTITITGTPFGVLVTASDATALAIRLVMTTKGYTIAN